LVHAIIGDTTNAQTAAAAKRAAISGVPLISFTATASSLSNRSVYPTLFRTAPDDTNHANAIAQFCTTYGLYVTLFIAQY